MMIYAYPGDPIHFLIRGVNRRLLKVQSDLVASITLLWGCREFHKVPFGNVDLTPHKKLRSLEEHCVFRLGTRWEECKIGQLANIFFSSKSLSRAQYDRLLDVQREPQVLCQHIQMSEFHQNVTVGLYNFFYCFMKLICSTVGLS